MPQNKETFAKKGANFEPILFDDVVGGEDDQWIHDGIDEIDHVDLQLRNIVDMAGGGGNC